MPRDIDKPREYKSKGSLYPQYQCIGCNLYFPTKQLYNLHRELQHGAKRGKRKEEEPSYSI